MEKILQRTRPMQKVHQIERRRRTFANGSEAEDTQEGDNDTENDSEETESNSPENSTTFHSENLCENCENSNVNGTQIMKFPRCSWHDYYKIVLYVITRSPMREITSKRAFVGGATIVEQ